MMKLLRILLNNIKTVMPENSSKAAVLLIIALLYIKKITTKDIPMLTLSEFLKLLSNNSVAEVCVNGQKLFFKGPEPSVWLQTDIQMLTKDRLFKLLRKAQDLKFSTADIEKGSWIINLLIYAAFYYLGYKIIDYYLNKQRGSRSIKPEYNSDTRFTDIYGLDEAKNDLQEIINYLKAPSKYKAVGARLRRGVLLYGPSGIGKTLLARAVAGEAGVAFLSCAASEFIELYVGVGAKRVRELFDKARKLCPCIIFIDEIDGIGLKRKSQFTGLESGGDDERTSTLNQLLTEMDGFKGNHDIVIIAATNRAHLLDEALLRSGRFDTKIKLELPNLEERIGIMRIHLRNKKNQVSTEVLTKIGQKSDKYSGADLENIVNESAYVCVQKGRDIVMDADIEESFTKVSQQRNVAYM